jgi:hypothetical protein
VDSGVVSPVEELRARFKTPRILQSLDVVEDELVVRFVAGLPGGRFAVLGMVVRHGAAVGGQAQSESGESVTRLSQALDRGNAGSAQPLR